MVEISTPEDKDIKSNFEPCGARCACSDRQTEQSRATNAALFNEYDDEAAAEFYADPANRRATGPGIRQKR